MTSETPEPTFELREDLELSHFRAAEVVNFDASDAFEMPPMMSANPPAEAAPNSED